MKECGPWGNGAHIHRLLGVVVVAIHTLALPLGEGPCPTSKFQQSVSTRRSQLRVATTSARFNGSSQLEYQDLNQNWLDKIRKVLSS